MAYFITLKKVVLAKERKKERGPCKVRFSPLTSDAKKVVSCSVKARINIDLDVCVTDRHDLTFNVKMLNSNTKSVLRDLKKIRIPGGLTVFLAVKEVECTYLALNPIPNKPWVFTCLQNKPFENTVGKREIALTEQFLLFPQCFLSVWRTLSLFH